MCYIRSMKTFEYRLYPTETQRTLLMNCLKESRELYNEMLTLTKQQYDTDQTFAFKYDLCKAFRGRGISTPASVVQTLAGRLDGALRRFLDTSDSGVKFPRFKPPNRWHSIHLRQYGKGRDANIDGKYLAVPAKLGKRIKIKLHRPIDGIPQTCHLVLRADKHWYALIVCEILRIASDESKPDVGLDMGLKSFLVDSDGNVVKPPQFFRKTQSKLRLKQRTIARRKKGSYRRRKACRDTAKLHLKVVRQRRDFLFKAAKPYADQYSVIYVEDLNIAGMLKNHHLAKSIADAGWNSFMLILEHKAESAGGRVVKVPAQYTSQRCSQCSALVPKSLSVRTHVCPECSFIADRDHNAALEILRLGRSRQALTWADVRPCVV